MSVLAPHHVFSYEAYLEHEKLTGAKHELVNGQVFAMSGGTPEHARCPASGARSPLDPLFEHAIA